MIRKRHKIPSIRKSRKNVLTLLIITILSWILLTLTVAFLDPYKFGVIGLFFIILFIALLLSFSIILTSSKSGFIYAIALTLFVFLRYIGLGHLINFLLIVGLAIVSDFLFVR